MSVNQVSRLARIVCALATSIVIVFVLQGCQGDKKVGVFPSVTVATAVSVPTVVPTQVPTQMPTSPSPTVVPKHTEIPQESTAENVCSFSKKVALHPGKTYDMLGTEIFDTVVCGYIILRDESGGEAGNVQVTIPYFVILRFADSRFEQSIAKLIDSGNGVETKEGSSYLFNLGCCKEGRIEGIERPDGNPYIDQQTEEAILSSTPDHPLRIILSFGEHAGTGCICCNLAHRVRLY